MTDVSHGLEGREGNSPLFWGFYLTGVEVECWAGAGDARQTLIAWVFLQGMRVEYDPTTFPVDKVIVFLESLKELSISV